MPDNTVKGDPRKAVELPDVNRVAYHRAEVIALNTQTVLKSVEAPLALLKLTADPALLLLARKSIMEHLDVLETIAHAASLEVIRAAKPPLLLAPSTAVLQ